MTLKSFVKNQPEKEKGVKVKNNIVKLNNHVHHFSKITSEQRETTSNRFKRP